MNIVKFAFNPLQENTYILWDQTKECAIIDAGNASAREDRVLADFIAENGLTPVLAINTHGHFDHLLGVAFLQNTYGVKFAMSKADASIAEQMMSHCAMFGLDATEVLTIDIDLATATEIGFGETTLRVIPTPGHTPGGVSLLHTESGALFTGDTLFRECIGRTDLTGGDYNALMNSILTRIIPLGDEITIYSGHGDKSTIGHESLYNPFVVEAINNEVNYN